MLKLTQVCLVIIFWGDSVILQFCHFSSKRLRCTLVNNYNNITVHLSLSLRSYARSSFSRMFFAENFGDAFNPLIDTLLVIYLGECQSRWDFFRRCSLGPFRFAATAGIRNALKSPAKWINAILAVVDWHGDTKSIDAAATRNRCTGQDI